MTCSTIKGCVWEDSAFNLLARVESAGVDVTQATVDTISWKAFSVLDEATVIASGSLVVAAAIFNELQMDRRWAGVDNAGYNFLHVVPSTILTAPGSYRIQHLFTMTNGDVFYLSPFEPKVESIWDT